MKYRIKIITYKSGKVLYFAQVRRFPFWNGILSDGGELYTFDIADPTRELALKRIDKHFSVKDKDKKQTIEFEYITKL